MTWEGILTITDQFGYLRTMGNQPLFASLIVAGMALSGCTLSSKVDLWRVATSGRDGYQHPEKVIEALDLPPGARVAEIGAGDGYWVPWLSEAVGPEGRVYAVEVEQEKVVALEDWVSEEGYANVEVVFGDYDDPKLPDAEIDLAMTSMTYHHIEDRVPYFRRLQSDLAPGGRVAHIDNRVGLPFPIRLMTEGHDSAVDDVEREMTEAGYAQRANHDFLYAQIFLIYAPESGGTE